MNMMTCAVVGSSSKLLYQNYGEEIDEPNDLKIMDAYLKTIETSYNKK